MLRPAGECTCNLILTLQKRALYADTDSVIYIQPRDGAALLKTGDCLGDMTSELKLCEYISEFVSGRPKNYAHQTRNTDTGAEATVCKVRGITLNYSASQLVNFERLKQMILKGYRDAHRDSPYCTQN